jgi:alkanesulfonate monooxygenase SsuD/methylene tetrahydromethanopterin reductase-like flavin-dependent oxidoreductase (luciferase family)
MFGALTGIDFSKYDLDDPIEYVESNAIQSVVEAMTKHNPGAKLRVRDLTRFGDVTGNVAFIAGSTEQVCDRLIEWVETTGIDGFNLARTLEPQGFASFVDLVVPELQRRGYYKKLYTPGTMREKTFPGKGPRLPDEHYGASFSTRRKSSSPA